MDGLDEDDDNDDKVFLNDYAKFTHMDIMIRLLCFYTFCLLFPIDWISRKEAVCNCRSSLIRYITHNKFA